MKQQFNVFHNGYCDSSVVGNSFQRRFWKKENNILARKNLFHENAIHTALECLNLMCVKFVVYSNNTILRYSSLDYADERCFSYTLSLLPPPFHNNREYSISFLCWLHFHSIFFTYIESPDIYCMKTVTDAVFFIPQIFDQQIVLCWFLDLIVLSSHQT